MERREAISRLNTLIGKDLVQLASSYEVTVWRGDKINKGWAGHVIERFLELPLNSAQSPNFGSWELKVVPLKVLQSGKVVPKETMAITMIDPINVGQKSFVDSHLFAKLRKMVVCARMFNSKEELSSRLISVGTFDLGDQELYNQVEEDYEEVRDTIRADGFGALTGKMGTLVQPRTKGPGHGSVSRAFYARTGFVATILGL